MAYTWQVVVIEEVAFVAFVAFAAFVVIAAVGVFVAFVVVAPAFVAPTVEHYYPIVVLHLLIVQ